LRANWRDVTDRLSAGSVQHTTRASDESLMRNHVLAHWRAVPIDRVDHLAVQQRVAQLGSALSPASVDKCHNLLSLILAAAVRDRLIGVNPADSVRLPCTRVQRSASPTCIAMADDDGIRSRTPYDLDAGWHTITVGKLLLGPSPAG
jgi:hypothetical protein